MNKAELVAAVAEKTNFTKKDAEAAVNALIASIEEALGKRGDKVQPIALVLLKQEKEKQDREEILENRVK